MWVRGVIGLVLVVVGGLWIAQGSGAVHGSMMSGHSQYAALGVVVVLIGLALIGWAWRIRENRRPRA
jgi:protein-S-isoprenylcysteine O-methyltransferase Ste14